MLPNRDPTFWPLRDGRVQQTWVLPTFPGLCWKRLVPATFLRGWLLDYHSYLTSREPELKAPRRLYPLRVTCSWSRVQNPSSVAWRWRQILTCNLHSRDTHGIRGRLVLHLQLQFWSAVSPALSCFPHSLTIHQENFLNKTTSTWTWSKTSWQASFATEICPGMELESQIASSEFFTYF